MLSLPTNKYLERMISFSQAKPQNESIPAIHVDKIVSWVASFYEKIKQVINYQEEHLLKKNSILRILNRRLILSKDPKELASPLIFELIRGGYFPNDRIPENKIEKTQNLLEKYIYLLDNIPSHLIPGKRKSISNWLKGMAACEIEQTISAPRKEKALLEYMVQTMKEKIRITNHISEEEKNIQLKIACQKNLLKTDETLISFWLFKYYVPKWPNLSEQELISLSRDIFVLKKKIAREISSPVGRKISRVISKYTVLFLIIGDVVDKNPTKSQEIFESSQGLEEALLEAYNKRLKDCRTKTRRSGIRSIISIFFSRFALLLLVEIPFAIYVMKKLAIMPWIIGLVFPPFLMFLIASSIKLPKSENAPQVAMEAIKIIKASENPEIQTIRAGKKINRLLNVILTLMFLAISGAIFGAVVYFLSKLYFGILNIVIFFIFFCLVAFSGLKTHVFSNELKMETKKEGLKSFVSDLFFLPFIKAGKYLSGKLKQYNFFIFLLNLFFESPIQTFFEFLEVWRGYLKEKREETE